jgi:hypothetical protein
MFQDFAFTFVVVAIGATILAMLQRKHPRGEVQLLLGGFVIHAIAVFIQVWIIREVYGGGDIDAYYRSGVEVANGLRADFENIAPEVLKVFFHQEDYLLPFQVFGGPSTTGSQTVVAAGLFYLLGDSLYAASMVVSLWAFFGKLAIFYAMRDGFPAHMRKRILIAATLIPSVAFWSATIAKEAVVLGFLGLATLILRNALKGDKFVARLSLVVLFLSPVAMIKPYVLLPFSVAAGVWVYWDRTSRRGASVVVKPAYLVIGALVGLAGVLVIGRLSPQFAVENLAQSTATIQAAGARAEGGSYYQLGAVPTGEDQSLRRQLVLMPIALPTALFRPLLIEVRNPMMFVNAIETTLLLVLFIRLVHRGKVLWLRRTILASPMLMFCFTFTVLLGTAVGLASTNLGSLSRYRMPFMPFFVMMLLVLDLKLRELPATKPVSLTRPAEAPVSL